MSALLLAKLLFNNNLVFVFLGVEPFPGFEVKGVGIFANDNGGSSRIYDSSGFVFELRERLRDSLDNLFRRAGFVLVVEAEVDMPGVESVPLYDNTLDARSSVLLGLSQKHQEGAF